MSHDERRITVDNGKYTFFVPEGDWRIHVHRHGEPWMIIDQGSKAVFSMMCELIDSRELIGQLHKWRARRDNVNMTGPFYNCDAELAAADDQFRELRGYPSFDATH